jgi:hypothetical protein
MSPQRILMLSFTTACALALVGCSGGGPEGGGSAGGLSQNVRFVDPNFQTIENIVLFKKFKENRQEARQPDYIGLAVVAAPTNGPIIDGLLVLRVKGKPAVRHTFLAIPSTRIIYGTVPVSFSFIIPKYDVCAVTVNDRKIGIAGAVADYNAEKGNTNIFVAQTIRLVRP